MNIIHIFAFIATIITAMIYLSANLKNPHERFDLTVAGVISGILWVIAEITRIYG